MIRHSLNFILGTAATAGTATALNGIDPSSFGSLEELIKYMISIVGGILATIIISILKKKFPEWFTNQCKNSR
jgi:hypothetical protein